MRSIENTPLSKISRRSWTGWFLLTFFCIFQFSLQGSVGILADSMKDSLQLDANSLSLLSSSFYYSYVLMQIPVGYIFDRSRVRNIATAALLLVGLSLCLFASATSISVAIAARVLMGLSCSFGFLGLVVATGRWFPNRYFALFVAAMECIGMLGTAVFNSVLSELVTHYDWRVASWACAGVGLFLASALYFSAPKEDLSHEESSSQMPLLKSLKCVISYKEVWYGGLFAFAMFAVITVFAGLWAIPFFMASDPEMDLVTATSVISMIFIGSAVGSPIVGWISSSFKSYFIMIPNAILSILVMLLIIYGPKSSLIVLYALIFSLGFLASVYQLPFAIVNSVVPAKVKGVSMGFTNIICMLSGPILQPIIGYFLASSQHAGGGFEDYPVQTFQTALLVLPACLLLSLYLAFKLQRRT